LLSTALFSVNHPAENANALPLILQFFIQDK